MSRFDTPEKKHNREIYKDTVELCKTESVLKAAIAASLAGQQVILETDELSIPEASQNEDSVVLVTDKRSFRAAMDHTDGKIGVLNFASSTKPGGGVAYGARAQEEGLCRISTLMQCISDKNCMKSFYEPHKAMKYPLHNDDIIYTPDVVIIKEDNEDQTLMPQSQWKTVSVISCAAPCFSAKPSNRYNPDDGDGPIFLPKDQLGELLEKRIERIFEVAYINDIEILILGAFGCGAFKNPPEVVAEAFDHVIKQHKNWFKVIEFAVPRYKDNPNNGIFNKWFGTAKAPAVAPAEVVKTIEIPEIPDIKGQKLYHKTFGEGIVTGIDGKKLAVDFGSMEKSLMLEYIFSGPAHLEDKELDDKLYEIAKIIKSQA